MRALKRAWKLRRNPTFVEFYNARASRNDSPPVSIDGTDRPGHKWGANVHQVGFCCLRCSVGTELTCLIRMANSPLLKRSSSQWCNWHHERYEHRLGQAVFAGHVRRHSEIHLTRSWLLRR